MTQKTTDLGEVEQQVYEYETNANRFIKANLDIFIEKSKRAAEEYNLWVQTEKLTIEKARAEVEADFAELNEIGDEVLFLLQMLKELPQDEPKGYKDWVRRHDKLVVKYNTKREAAQAHQDIFNTYVHTFNKKAQEKKQLTKAIHDETNAEIRAYNLWQQKRRSQHTSVVLDKLYLSLLNQKSRAADPDVVEALLNRIRRLQSQLSGSSEALSQSLF